jgi:hypothetical protein
MYQWGSLLNVSRSVAARMRIGAADDCGERRPTSLCSRAQTPAPHAPRKPKRATLHADARAHASATGQLLRPPVVQPPETSQLLRSPIVQPSKAS